jgi:nitrogen-specific signal transduction histidine kinase/CheY-like chemotaxis protein
LVFRDISQRKREEQQREKLQAQLFQAQRMEAIGVLAGGIAHEFNNLMTTVIGTSSLMLSGLDDTDPLRDGLERIRKASERAASLTQQILALSRKQTPQHEILDLNAVVIDMEEMLQRLVGADTNLVNALEPGFRYIRADPAQIEQIIMSLIVNAHEALPEGGQVTVTTETVTLDEDQCQHLPEVSPGTYVRLSVVDTGVGMDEETIQHIFEPFFSTKPKGSGLGLAIAHNIVRQEGGWIDVSSELGRGSTFQVYLPAFVTELEYEPPEIAPPTEIQGAGERILLVEDDEGVCAAVSEMLGAGGYEVVTAENAKKAADAFEEQEGNFHLVFCDVVLPDKDGLELVGELLSQKPGLAVLLTSGYTDERTQWLLIREHGFRFLQKPFGLTDLLPAVREAIHESRDGSAP